jgi:hypothetical protein
VEAAQQGVGLLRTVLLYGLFCLAYAGVLAAAICLVSHLWVGRSLRESLHHCLRNKGRIVLVAGGCTVLFAVVEATVAAPYLYYIVPGVTAPAVLLIAGGVTATPSRQEPECRS